MKHISKKIFQLNTDDLKNEFNSNKKIKFIIFENFLNLQTAEKILDNYDLNINWTNYSFVNNFKKYGLTNINKMNIECRELFQEMNSRKFIDILKKITDLDDLFLDLSLDGGGLHQIFNNGYLNIHTDFYSHSKNNWVRKLNILIYLNKDWKKEHRGELEFWNENVDEKIVSIEPRFNRCVVFLTNQSSFHGHPSKYYHPENKSRKSIAAYYYQNSGNIKTKYKPTKYKPLPTNNFKDSFMIQIDNKLNYIYSFMKRKGIVNDKMISKILTSFNFFNKK